MGRMNPVGWFEIPVSNTKRSKEFYEKVFGYTLEWQSFGDLRMARFPAERDDAGSGGALVHMPEMYEPSDEGVLVYFSAPSGDLKNELSRVEPAGGRVIVKKRSVGEFGCIGVFIDSEGNRVGLVSRE